MSQLITKVKSLLTPIYYSLRALYLRFCYRNTLAKLKKEFGKRELRIGFLVSEISKWKGQTLYDLLEKTQGFFPEILVYPYLLIDKDDIDGALREKLNYFKLNNMNVRSIWNEKDHNCCSDLNVDVAFYQQPWDIPPAPRCQDIAKNSLTFYYPYFLVNNFDKHLELELQLHYCVFRYVLLNNKQVELYKPFLKRSYYAGKMVGLGHPIIDVFYLNKHYKGTKGYVIYAPHFSIQCNNSEEPELPYYSSTFLENGKLILEYAIKHPEINWVFKPHPRLRRELIKSNSWTEDEVNAYYKGWEEVGLACYNSHYTKLFLEAKAMITDCSSFLTEFAITEKPIIRLIPNDGKTLLPPNPVLSELYDSYYKVYNNDELIPMLDSIVLMNEDPMKEKRTSLVKEVGLTDNYAAQNIVNYINTLLS